MLKKIARWVILLIGLFYAYGALVHLLNIFGFNGFNWIEAPIKWQVLDIFYLVVDVIVAIGFFKQWKLAYYLFYVAALSQILLYTILRQWIIDVPKEFALNAEQVGYLDTLVLFHIITIVLVTIALYITYIKSYCQGGSKRCAR